MAYRNGIAAGVVALGLVLAGRAEAQPLIILPDRLAVSASLGLSGNGDLNSGDRSPDISGALELPLEQPFRLRLGAGRVLWGFGGRDAQGPTQPRDTVSLTRGTLSILKTLVPPMAGGMPVAAYVGGGVGIYHYGFRHGVAAVPTRWGLHALAGIEYILPNDRLVLGWEAQLHAVRGPSSSTVASYEFFVLQTSMAVKYRF
jgi:hypothetical protein